MHYKQIKKDTPEAFKKLKKWINAETKGILQFELMMILKNERELFDFFDEMGIFITIIHRDTIALILPFHWKIRGEISEGYANRKEAEKVAYKKAFNLLEKQ